MHHLIPRLAAEVIGGTSRGTHLDNAEEFNRIPDEFLVEVHA